jgi:FkbM family methyltransferase
MSSTFLSSYLREVTLNLSNWHEDNYDFYRFGPQPEERAQRSWKTPIIDYLRGRGYVPDWQWSNEVMAAIQLVDTHLARFEWLYNQLADDESRDILVRVLAYWALGYRRVKLPLNTPAYWDGLKQIVRLASSSDFIPVSFLNSQLHLMDLNAIGVPVQFYFIPAGAYWPFVLELYRCRRDGVDIAVETGDCVIDVGACWGDTALYFAHKTGPDGKVISYEFVPDNLKILRRNLALNLNLSNRIQIIESAAWDESNLAITVQGEGPGSRVSVGEASGPNDGPLTLTIDDLVQRQNLTKVDFIKMDIEGAELHALRGATQTIQHQKPKLAISVYHDLTHFFEVPGFLDSLDIGYRFFLRHYTIHAEETVLFAETDQRLARSRKPN